MPDTHPQLFARRLRPFDTMDGGESVRWQGMLENSDFLSQITAPTLGTKLYDAFFAPGDYILSVLLLRAPTMASSAGIGLTDYGGAQSAMLSLLFWLTLLVVLKTCFDVFLDLLHTAFAWVRAAYLNIMRQVRAIRTMLYCASRRRSSDNGAALPVSLQEISLDALEMGLLRIQIDLSPGYIISTREASKSLSVRTWKANKAFARLHELGLVEPTFGAGDGDEGYRLTTLGRQLATAQTRRRRADIEIGNLDLGDEIAGGSVRRPARA